jgi:NADH-quinone oxidoreductase subunit M
MFDSPLILLSLVVFLPAIGALVVACLPSDKDDLLRGVTLAFTFLVLVAAVLGFLMSGSSSFDPAVGTMQNAFNVEWIPSFDIYYMLGMDGISFPLVMLTAVVSILAMGASWSIKKHVKAYCILFLLLETGMLGVFLALDFFLFYVFWEVMLLPMYFLIGVWGGERREYAAIKFFLYTLVGSVLMLIAILMLYFNSDVREVAKVSDINGTPNASVVWSDLKMAPSAEARVGRVTTDPSREKNAALVLSLKSFDAAEALNVAFVVGDGEANASYNSVSNTVEVEIKLGTTAKDVVVAINADPESAAILHVSLPNGSDGLGKVAVEDSVTGIAVSDQPVHSFNILAMTAMGQKTEVFSPQLQWWAFVLLFIGFAIKVPSIPLHTWLPDAHVQAPTPISMILAGVLLKMGGYGIIRICYPICPHGGYDLMYVVCGIGVASMVYGAFAALAQTDFKRMVAYSSVSHMGYVVLGLGVWSATKELAYDSSFWNMGVQGAMFQMIGHGISSAGMFFMVGVVYDRVHHRNLNEFGALFAKMPVYTALAIGLFFAGLGLPGLCGFIGEVFVVLSVFAFSIPLAVISAAVVILTAAYILWAIQRVYLGADYKGPHEEALVPATTRENLIAGTLFVLAILFGVFPHFFVLNYMEKTIGNQVESLADWTKTVKEAKPEVAAHGDENSEEHPAENGGPVPNVNEDNGPVTPEVPEVDGADARVPTGELIAGQ